MVKRIRGVVKQLLPYAVEANYIRTHYGMESPQVGWPQSLLPYGLVRALISLRKPKDMESVKAMAVKLGLFDGKWYAAGNPDVDFTVEDPLEHFFATGWKEGREPSPNFSMSGYLARYKDVLLAGMNPLTHYLTSGQFEGRDTCAPGPFLGGEPTWSDRRLARRRTGDPFFSVIVASYNYEDLVLETLESLVSQTYGNFEIVVVDDGSTDKSRDNIRSFIEAHRDCGVPISLHTHPEAANRGLAATVRLGLEKSKGEFVAFCESDDLWTPDHLAEVAAFVRRYGSAEVIVNDVDIFGDPMRVFRFNRIKALRYKRLRHARNVIPPSAFRELNYILTFSAVTVRRQLLLECDWNPVARPAALDWWLWRQICFDRPVHFINRVLTRWRMHDSYMFKEHDAANRSRTLGELQREFNGACDGLLRRRHPFSIAARMLGHAVSLSAAPAYRFTRSERRAFEREREAGLAEFRETIGRHSHARILVCLHLFYEDAWELIAEYLSNLSPYGFELVVTCDEGFVSPVTLDAIRSFSPTARIVFVENKGFDVGPFVEVLRTVDLDAYDIVFKLQSKGIRRPRIYIYGQLFKYRDWFFNLYNGILGGRSVHRAVDAIMRGEASLVAADNLIVRDPKHKAFFMRRFCDENRLECPEGYRFVAGTCFAAAANALKPLQGLGYGIDDFKAAVPGEFSLAHALERYMCFAANSAMLGVETPHPDYRAECARLGATSAIRLLDDPRFKLDYDFFYRALETRPVRGYEVVRVRLGDLTRYWYDGKLYPLEKCPPYLYLCGDRGAYADYCRQNLAVTGFEMTPERFERLCAEMKEFDPLSMPVVMGPRNIIQDGQHRSCILLKKFGPEHQIDVLRID